MLFVGMISKLAPPIAITSGTHTDGCTVIRKPGSAWLEGTPAMEPGLEGIRTYMQTKKIEIEQDTLA